MEHRSVLEAQGLVKVYKQRTVVRNASYTVRQGECVGLLGPNGAGKTTSFYMIVGMVRPDGGKVLLDGQDITFMPMYKRARMGIAYLPQEASVFRRLTVEQNILAVLELQPLSRQQRRERLEQLLEEFGIAHIRKSKGYVLSGGERRRTEIARALAANPRFILLDEPFAGIDPIAVEDIMTMVRRLKERNIGVLITDHNVHETLSITDRAYILIEGNVFCSGTPEEIAANPDVRRLYLGQHFTLERYAEER
ncbi:MAG: LPS export ABC transporter ATP-binding protein [Bacteroidota bacterium]|nr:LPS export ABC transporter ATP-binding protein [Candidatus Kapabacteria bacterium]MCS7302071.1 LPS export ABC transporter ATP-binding protein [Candidatus Kapabacteria bacterium]MCX7936537.1 LPS export ABC transporter ATP-binding protein [Chlorobiota bacterium]MDW8074698.1 LPS export ABC transporter ATP-binding protein [Bacteroidota bacterium]MDW8270826.1 LPS export ABC transporter ATP-binding protein [Bacteroidota bacterium]